MAGSLAASPTFALTPTATKVTTTTNYISSFAFLNQYLPDLAEKEFARYGNRSIASFLRLVGAEMPTNSDLIKWSEEGRLHIKYTGLTPTAISSGTQLFTVASGVCSYRIGQTVFLSGTNGSAQKGIITTVTSTTFTVAYYDLTTGASDPFGSGTVTSFVYGSEFQKGSAGMVGTLEAQNSFYDNKPIIIKDNYSVTGSDMAQIGWVEVEYEGGAGYLWYLKSNGETRMRFDDVLEMSMVEGVPAIPSSAALAYLSPSTNNILGVAAAATTAAGTKGLFYEVNDRGNVWSGGNPTALQDWDQIIQRLDKQGAIQENAIFLNRQFSFDMNDMIAAQNGMGAGGTSYGLFDNDEKMALNLGFTGFRRGYDFYKTDWKYLNDATLRGDITAGGVNGILVPAGSTNVYDEVLGEKVSRPFLHVRYRASEREDRRYKSWVTGSAGGAATSDVDEMRVNYLSERALCVLGANNFFLFKA
jgi:hypothetical protein